MQDTKNEIFNGTLSGILNEMREQQSGTATRQDLIKKIQKKNKSKVITYTSNFNHPAAGIMGDDIVPFAEALSSIGQTERIDLMINSPGGDPDSAEKIIKICRDYCNEFRVIVPNMAKSAATLIALGTDEIIMGYISELGPIDPQLIISTPQGSRDRIPARSITDSWEEMESRIKKEGTIPLIYIPILNNYDLSKLDYCRKAIDRTKKFAETWLQKYMFKADHKKAKEIAENLADVSTHLSHAKVIDPQDAIDMGLKINLLDKNNDLWQLIWELYVRSEVNLRSNKAIKLIETDKISISIN